MISVKEDVGVEWVLGMVFYVNGGFELYFFFEMYNIKVYNFRVYYKIVKFYLERVDMIYVSIV